MASTLCIRLTISPRAVAAMDNCFALVGAHQHGIVVGSVRGVNPRIRDPLLPRRVQALLLHRKQVVAVGWELQNSSPIACVWSDGIRAMTWGLFLESPDN